MAKREREVSKQEKGQMSSEPQCCLGERKEEGEMRILHIECVLIQI